ncbi:CPBP family intramembrane metalloprotease [Alkalihalobacillus sp. LMS6]|uniref:CPBP family intramembrane glutamic endopeptidase n=1 Tax=Alkalihalobacillus sp. LMS6 TaxID=2924034 RepID=UPI0020D0BAD3|nr:CPBP family intramembrane glutamic endopeptidase [Alkalihalobacillus sp. LMS6]UTR06134.1 CPBP family intramembrane metalloprotease [Alkalihalobacillus sp. LMS6]
MKTTFFSSMRWSYKELSLLLLLTLVIVPIGIEWVLQNFLQQLFQNSLYAGTMTGFVMAVVFTLGVYVIALRPHQLSWHAVGVRRFSQTYWKWIIVWTIVLIVASLLIVILMDLFQMSTENEKTESLTADMNWLTFSIGFISAAIISPIYEEIFYRGFLYRWFRVKWGMWAGLLCSSFIFTIVHVPTYNTLPVNFISGLVFAWTYEKTGSILPAILIHGTFNGLAVILTALG